MTDGAALLLGHATRSPRWDIPKGLAEPGETPEHAAMRELREETGLRAPPGTLVPLGVHAYLPGKDLALFAWRRAMPALEALRCTSMVQRPDGSSFPELDRFGVFTWPEAGLMVGRNLARLLVLVRDRI